MAYLHIILRFSKKPFSWSVTLRHFPDKSTDTCLLKKTYTREVDRVPVQKCSERETNQEKYPVHTVHKRTDNINFYFMKKIERGEKIGRKFKPNRTESRRFLRNWLMILNSGINSTSYYTIIFFFSKKSEIIITNPLQNIFKKELRTENKSRRTTYPDSATSNRFVSSSLPCSSWI